MISHRILWLCFAAVLLLPAVSHAQILDARLGDDGWRPCPELVQCPGGCCPGGQCPLQQDRLLPLRRAQPQNNGGAQNPWPTIQGTIAAGPDYSAKLDRLIELQEKAIAAQPVAAAAVGPDYGPQIREATDTAKEAAKKADDAKAAIGPAIEEAMKPVQADLTKLKPALELADKVQGKLEKLAELPGPLGKPAQKIEADLKAGNVDQALRDAAKAVGVVLLVLGLITAVVLHLIGQHKGAIRVLADNLAAQNPSNTTLASIAQKLDSVEDKVASKLPAWMSGPLPGLPVPIPGLAGVGAAVGVVDAAAHAKADLLAQQVSQLAGQVGHLQMNATPPAQAAAAAASGPQNLGT